MDTWKVAPEVAQRIFPVNIGASLQRVPKDGLARMRGVRSIDRTPRHGPAWSSGFRRARAGVRGLDRTQWM